jgi:hypothetical protein
MRTLRNAYGISNVMKEAKIYWKDNFEDLQLVDVASERVIRKVQENQVGLKLAAGLC